MDVELREVLKSKVQSYLAQQGLSVAAFAKQVEVPLTIIQRII